MLLLSHEYETVVVAEEQTWWIIDKLLNDLWPDAWKYIYDYDNKDTEKYWQKPQRIIVHHSATPTCNTWSINRAHLNRTNGYNSTADWMDISYHYIVQPDWISTQLREEWQVGWGTRLNNVDSIHILFCWNFNETEPTVEQYKEWAKLISEMREAYWEIPVFWHNQLEWEATACPWKNFDYRMLSFYSWVTEKEEPEEVKEPKEEWLLWVFNITKYYSCDPNQTKYLQREVNTLKSKLWREPTNEELYTECNRRQFNSDADNTQPKHWAKFSNADAGIAVACPKSVPWWTKLKIEWYDQTVVCRDVWSAITAWRLDLYVWIWDRAIDHYNNFPSGKAKVFIIK